MPNTRPATDDPHSTGIDDLIPRPDPSVLTTRQLLREIYSLRELMETKLGSTERSTEQIRQIIETRLDGMDKAIRLLQDTADKFPARIDEKIFALQSVHEEKFGSIQKQFDERDVRTEQAAGAVKIAVDAALQAQKEAAGEANRSSAASISKSEASFTKQIDLITGTIQTITKAFDDKVAAVAVSATTAIADVKDRVNRMEGGTAGSATIIGYVIAAIGILIGLSRFIAP